MAKKIGAIVSVSIIGVLILATIIMASINVNYSINCAKPQAVYVAYKTLDQENSADIYTDEIIEYINNASKENSLTALFNGNLGKKATVNVKSSAGLTIQTTTGYFVRYHYTTKQNLMEGNSKFTDNKGNVVQYEDLVFVVKANAGSVKTTVYVIPEADEPDVYTHQYILEANFDDLYDFLAEKFKQN